MMKLKNDGVAGIPQSEADGGDDERTDLRGQSHKMETLDKRNGTDAFVTVVSVQGDQAPSEENFVTVLSIGNGKKEDKQISSPRCQANGSDPHPEEEVEVFRLPGERLGFGLKFEGGNKTSEKVKRLFVQSCAEQSPASRAKCSWGNLGEGDEVLSIDGVPVTHMTRLDCVRHLKESQLVIKLVVRCRGALRPEVVSAERKTTPEKSKIPPELPSAPPPVPPRKLRQTRGFADGEANPSPVKKSWDTAKSSPSSLNGSPQSQASFRSNCSSGGKSSTYESCNSTPAKSCPGSKNDSPKESPKGQSPELAKSKQVEPPEAMIYTESRSQDCASVHGSTSDDTSSTLSTVVDRFSTSDRVSTVSSITSDHQYFENSSRSDAFNGDLDCEPTRNFLPDNLDLTSNIVSPFECFDREFAANQPDFLLKRLASSEAVTFVESRGEAGGLVERVTAVVAPNKVLIEETITLQPPLSFQDAPLSYGNEPRPGIFYAADLAADSKTHFRPIKDDAAIVECVNGVVRVDQDAYREYKDSAPPLPARNHVNRIPVNQQALPNGDGGQAVDASQSVSLPPKPMPRRDAKAKRKRPPPPPPPVRREPQPIPESFKPSEPETTKPQDVKDSILETSQSNELLVKSSATEEVRVLKEDILTDHKEESQILETENLSTDEPIPISDDSFESCNEDSSPDHLNKRPTEPKSETVLEIVEIKKAKSSDDPPVLPSADDSEPSLKVEICNSDESKFNENIYSSKGCKQVSISEPLPTDESADENSSENEEEKAKIVLRKSEIVDERRKEQVFNDADDELDEIEQKMDSESEDDEDERSDECPIEIVVAKEIAEMIQICKERNGHLNHEESSDESDGDYYWQSNLATIGEEEENNSLEYTSANQEIIEPEQKATEKLENPKIVLEQPETTEEKARDEVDCVRRIARDSGTEDKKPDKNLVNGRMEHCGGGQRLPPDGDEFPAAYQEFNNPNLQYQFVTRDSISSNGDLSGTNETFINSEKLLHVGKAISIAENRTLSQCVHNDTSMDTKPPSPLERTSLSYLPFNGKKTNTPNLVSEKKIEISGYYPKEISTNGGELLENPPPLPLTGPPKIDSSFLTASNRTPAPESVPNRKFSMNGDLWRQDDKSEKSVRDKIAMFSSQSNLEAPLFPSPVSAVAIATNGNRRLSKHKSSDDVFSDEKRSNSSLTERTQSSFDLTCPGSNQNHDAFTMSGKYTHQKVSNFLHNTTPNTVDANGKDGFTKKTDNKFACLKTNSSSNSYPITTNGNSVPNHNFDPLPSSITRPKSPTSLTRATSFSGGSTFRTDQHPTPNESLSSPQISRTNSLASTFKRPNDETRRNSLNQLIEQRRKGISKLRGLVIPEKDAVPIDQPIIDLPEIKSRDSILANQVPRTNIQDKWGSQNSLISNASTVSSSVKATASFKMPAPQILSKYSPAFKRKSLTTYTNSSNSSSSISSIKMQLHNSASNDAPKSLESICSPTRSDYSFDYVSSNSSPDNNRSRPRINVKKNGRSEYDDSDNDSAVSSSQSSISRGFSPPMSPVPSERSTLSSDRSYASMETNYHRAPVILDGIHRSNGTVVPDRLSFLSRSSVVTEKHCLLEKSSSVDTSPNFRLGQTTDASRTSQIPQPRMNIKRSSSTETNSSSSSTVTSGLQTSGSAESRRFLKPQSVEAINRKNILASARCRSGRDLNGSPLIQRKFDDEETPPSNLVQENGGFINGNTDSTKPQVKIAYIEITKSIVESDKMNERNGEESRVPAKRTIPHASPRPPKPEVLEPSNGLRSWVRAEVKTLTETNSAGTRKSSITYDSEVSNARTRLGMNSIEKSSITIQRSHSLSSDAETDTMIEGTKSRSKSSLALKKSVNDQNDLLTVLTTRSRSRSAIHVEESSHGRSKSQMSLEDILAVKSENKHPRNQSIADIRTESNGMNHSRLPLDVTDNRFMKRSNSTDSWTDEKPFSSRIPGPSRSKHAESVDEVIETTERSKLSALSKIPTCRSLSRKSASVTDMKKAFERSDISSISGPTSPGSQYSSNGIVSHNRFPSLDSSIEDSIRPVGSEIDSDRFGSISSLASSTSLISQQELAQLLEEANLEEARGSHDVIVVLLHKENPTGSVGITLAGGLDCETKEITVHRVLLHSIADKDGRVQRGDRILSINGRSTRSLTHRESLAVLKQPRSEVVLVISRAKLDEGGKLRSRTDSVETIVEGLEINGVSESIAWGPSSAVCMYKDGAGLGFSLEGGRDSPLGDRPLVIKKIFTGGAAEKSGALQAGDQLLEVNHTDVTRMSRIEAWSLMKKLPNGEVNLLVRHPATKSS